MLLRIPSACANPLSIRNSVHAIQNQSASVGAINADWPSTSEVHAKARAWCTVHSRGKHTCQPWSIKIASADLQHHSTHIWQSRYERFLSRERWRTNVLLWYLGGLECFCLQSGPTLGTCTMMRFECLSRQAAMLLVKANVAGRSWELSVKPRQIILDVRFVTRSLLAC